MNTKEIIAYLKDEYRIEVTGQTVRNWQKKGRCGVMLPEKPTKRQIGSYLGKVGTNFSRGRPRAT
jgi:hypothetical protein